MPRTKKVELSSEGCLEIRLPMATVEAFSDLQPGYVMCLSGKSHAGSHSVSEQAEDVSIEVEKQEQSLCLLLLATAMGSVFKKKLTQRWSCQLSDVHIRKGQIKADEASVIQHQVSCRKNLTEDLKKASVKEEMNHPEANRDADDNSKDCSSKMAAQPKGDLHTEKELALPKDAGDGHKLEEDNETEQSEDDGSSSSEEDVTVNDGERTECLTGATCMFCKKNYSGESNSQQALDKHLLRRCTRNPWSRNSVAPEPTISEKYPLKCIYCPKAFDTQKRLEAHQERCPRNPEYMAQFDKESLKLKICEICDRLFANDKALTSHKVVVHGYTRAKDADTKYPCRYCQLPFNCRGTRYHHETYKCSLNPNVTQLTYCRICDKKMSKEKLEDHMKESHTKEERHVCDMCGAVFPSSRRLYTHMYAHKKKVPKHRCPTCGRMFKLKNQMERHLTTHTEERNVQCPICGKCFKNIDQERDHRLAIHEGRYKYRCEKCGHGMAKKVYLDNHRCGRVRRIQDGEKMIKLLDLKKSAKKTKNGCSAKSQDIAVTDQMPRTSYLMPADATFQGVALANHEAQIIQQQSFMHPPPPYNNFSTPSTQLPVQSLQSAVQSVAQSVSQPLGQSVVSSSLEISLQSAMPLLQSTEYQNAQSTLHSTVHLTEPSALQSTLQSSLEQSVMLESSLPPSLQASTQPPLQSSV